MANHKYYTSCKGPALLTTERMYMSDDGWVNNPQPHDKEGIPAGTLLILDYIYDKPEFEHAGYNFNTIEPNESETIHQYSPEFLKPEIDRMIANGKLVHVRGSIDKCRID